MNIDLRTKGLPLIVSSRSAAKILGVGKEAFQGYAEALGIVPVTPKHSHRSMLKREQTKWSLPEILKKLEAWSDGKKSNVDGFPIDDFPEEIGSDIEFDETPCIIDDGRTRKPRQKFMRSIVGANPKKR